MLSQFLRAPMPGADRIDQAMTPFDRPVTDFMSAPVETIHPDSSLAGAERRLQSGAYSCLAVVGGDGQLCGVLSRTDILHIGRLHAAAAEQTKLLTLPHQLVRARMICNVVTAERTTPLHVAAFSMLQHYVHRVFVVDNGRPVGVLSTRDLMRALVESRIAMPLSQFMTSPVKTVQVTDSVAVATDLLHQSRVRGLVVEEQEWPVGVFTQTEALAAAPLDAGTPVEAVMSCALLCLSPNLPLFRAAAFALQTRARRILVVNAREVHGIVSGLDMARAIAGHAGSR